MRPGDAEPEPVGLEPPGAGPEAGNAGLWPRSLVWRTLAVLLLGVLVSNVAGLALYSDDRLGSLTRARGRQIAEQVAAAADAVRRVPQSQRQRALRSMRQPGLRLYWSQRSPDETGDTGWRLRVIREAFRDEFGEIEPGRLRLAIGARQPRPASEDAPPGEPSLDGAPSPPSPAFTPSPGPLPPPRSLDEGPHEPGDVFDRDHPHPRPARWVGGHGALSGPPDVRMLTGAYRLDDGSWLQFAAPILAVPPFWETHLFLAFLATTAVVLGIAVWAVLRAIQPLAMFASAAERLGRDVDAPPLAVAGPLEVRRAALAFNQMQQRLQRFVRDRTQMLAAMSHDLRTPLTRLRLRAELIEDEEEQRKTIADLEEMREMVDSVLSFARDEAAVEPPTSLDLAALLQTVCDEAADAGADATYDGPSRAPCVGRPAALKRAFANLVVNGVTWGGSVRVALDRGEHRLRVTVDDPGPGIPEAELSRVFEPFRRLEGSRNRETGGVGLGLAIVRAAIAAHGGAVALANLQGGGLRATVDLPAPGSGATADRGPAARRPSASNASASRD